ncbi:MAG TPA: enoyl-CoA hydratase/isomerase family protein [Chitinivibrionales bacterium]|nr:enoyl-CoA hydratase/isomerase family protein [Chitinivibrionales bacterium]
MKLLYSITGSIGRIVLSNPPYNYLPEPEFENPDTLKGFLSRKELTGIVVSGEGKHFCAGADTERLSELTKNPSALKDAMEKGKSLLDIIRYATVPVVAAVRGSCLGGGLEIALACHFRFAVKSAMLGFPESQRLLMPGLGGTVFSQEVACRRHVIELAVSGKMIGAPEAREMGIVDQCFDGADLEGEAQRFLCRLTEGRPAALVRSIMTSIHNARTLPLDEALRRETELFCDAARKNHGQQP